MGSPSNFNNYVTTTADWRASLRANSRRTFFVIGLFFVIYIGLGLLVDMFIEAEKYPAATIPQLFTALVTFQLTPYATFVMIAVAGISIFVTFAMSDKLMLLGTEYKEITPQPTNSIQETQLYNVVEEMKIAAGLRFMPRVFVIEADYMNAFASGYSEKSAMVAITRGLMVKLNRSELQAVMAHELSHVRHMDIKLTLMASVLANLMLMVLDFFFYTALFSDRGSNSESRNKLAPFIIMLRYLLPVINVVLLMYLSRKREYMADAGCVELTRDNQALISALLKIQNDHAANKDAYAAARVIEVPSILWQPFLQLILLRQRPKKSAKLYEKIWTNNGSPLLHYSLEIAKKLEDAVTNKLNTETYVRIGMRYGNPSIKSALEELREKKVERLLIFPLYPQYSATTTASTFDGVAKTFKHWRHLPEVRMLNEYARDMDYIKALAESIRHHWQTHTKKYLLFSFHGIPQRYIDAGDPYAKLCHITAKLIADELQLAEKDWSLSFQSRLGPTKWLTPYTDKVLESLPKKNIKDLQVACPGFPVDCLETLEEIAIRGKEQFLEAGGQSFEYIPALNNSPQHIEALTEIISKVTNGW